jgi:hypothetical protein
MKIRVHSQRFVRLALTGMIGLGLMLALAVFMLASPGLAASPLASQGSAVQRSQAGLAKADVTILLTEDFSTASGSTPPAGWVNNVINGDENDDLWRFDNPGERDLIVPIVQPAAIFDSDAISDNEQPELVSLDSPTFDARGHTFVGLSFDHYFRATDGTTTSSMWMCTTVVIGMRSIRVGRTA